MLTSTSTSTLHITSLVHYTHTHISDTNSPQCHVLQGRMLHLIPAKPKKEDSLESTDMCVFCTNNVCISNLV